MVGGGGYSLAGDGWWWVVVDISWLVLGSDEGCWKVMDGAIV